MEKFNHIISKIFEIPETDVKDTMSSKDIPKWDSMNYLLFIAELEKEYNMSFTMDEVMNAQTVGDIRTIVAARKK